MTKWPRRFRSLPQNWFGKISFQSAAKVWSHARVAFKQKLMFLDGCIMAKLRHVLTSPWFVTSQRRRLDGFNARCLRRLLHIGAAFVFRISNKEVLKRADFRPLSERLRIICSC